MMNRRQFIGCAALFGPAPCACLAAASHDCCSLPEAPAGAVQIGTGVLLIDLDHTPELRRTGGAIKVVDSAHELRILIARPAQHQFVALDQKCTHGGGALTYVPRHRHLYCTCWGHAKFALDGSVLRWPNSQKPKPLRAYAVERRGKLLRVQLEEPA